LLPSAATTARSIGLARWERPSGTTHTTYLSARQTAVWLCGYWFAVAGVLRENGESPSSPPPLCRDRGHRTHARSLPARFPSFQGASTQKTTRTVEALQLPSSGHQGQEPSRFSCGRRLPTLRPPPPPPARLSLVKPNCVRPSVHSVSPKILPPPPSSDCSLESQSPLPLSSTDRRTGE
jgi:hypothetical protein